MTIKHVTLDSNVLVYAVDVHDRKKQNAAVEIIDAAIRGRCPLALQAVAEFYRASRKIDLAAPVALARVQAMLAAFPTFAHSRTSIAEGARLAARTQFSFWDAVLLASAEEAGCTIMLSEDMGDGARLGNITVRNPFGAKGLSDAAKEALGVA